MSVTQFSNVTNDRALLLFVLASGLSIDVRKIIFHSIKLTYRTPTTYGLRHPSLITELCRQAGVEFGIDKEMIFSRAFLNRSFVSAFQGRVEPEPHRELIRDNVH
ncbi:uncharacterized protein E5676_scaffold1721G00020 [Cucumis melo var. makuwa]|uniref:Putative plant transposon protein domain-containing protein n=1 Tax=Cucumis melo var. makuwa TaxID=1194695 RepID=A0A5D3DE04_CUCMM|nr:uncharacterized protein E5676_scaffold1721G00020 [Cucumis melo var. makuwa]